MRIVFFGSDDFAAVCFNELLNSSFQIVGVVTGPDMRQGRGMKLACSVIKQLALTKNIECVQPLSLKDDNTINHLKGFEADLFVVVAYGKILPQVVLDIPKIFCINVHGSLLPHYRGPAPIHWAILNGDQQTGVTVQKMALHLDAGDILAQESLEIGPQETTLQLRNRMAQVGAQVLVKTIESLKTGKIKLVIQDESKVSYAPKLTKEMGRIQWEKSAQIIQTQIRALQPWPGSFIIYQSKILKILEAQVIERHGIPGTIVDISKEGFTVACGQEGLLVKKVHMEAAKPLLAYDFLQGYHLKLGDQLK